MRKPYGIERDQGFRRENLPSKSLKETEGTERDQGVLKETSGMKWVNGFIFL